MKTKAPAKYEYLLLTEAALDQLLLHRQFDDEAMPIAQEGKGLFAREVAQNTLAIVGTSESTSPYSALVSVAAIERLIKEGRESSSFDLYSRIARVVKALASPPIHLPRQWSEFHHKNQLTFFALPRDNGAFRWLVDVSGEHRCARFQSVTTGDAQRDLYGYMPPAWPTVWTSLEQTVVEGRKVAKPQQQAGTIVDQVDLSAIGSASVVQGRTYEQWAELLTDDQRSVLEQRPENWIRMIGPAGSGKTLTLCLRVMRLARDELTIAQNKRILIVTHSWAMAERIDGVLMSLNGGTVPASITVLPLLYLLQLHTAQIGRSATKVIGDDSQSGYLATIEIIHEILPTSDTAQTIGLLQDVSSWILEALTAPSESLRRRDLVLNLYEEFTGVLAAGGVSIDDSESLQRYMSGPREDWMPPFPQLADRRFALETYKRFLRLLADRGAITTDQLVLDSIRVLETFSWRMRRESDGFDYIFVDELQLFDAQERSAIELLGRSSTGIPFTTAEDPSQGVFSALNARRPRVSLDQSVYLDCVHRFDPKIFSFIKFIYQRFPLNSIPLRIDTKKVEVAQAPCLYLTESDEDALDWVARRIQEILSQTAARADRTCVATLGDIEDALAEKLNAIKVPIVQLRSFDDVEQLSYRKKSVVLAPWQFIGGTQFSNVVVVVAGMQVPNTAFARLRELTAIYLACSRAAVSLDIVCGLYIPQVLQDAVDAKLLDEQRL